MRRAALSLLILGLAACAARGPVLPDQLAPELRQGPVELTGTPFNPQRRYQCGPAALATVLQASGMRIDADTLVPQVYLPGREGSLQVEMLAATRRQGRIPYVLEPDLDALVAELRAGRPVLVLQNLGLDALPQWHYAVVIGVLPDRDEIVLRSGTTERERMSAARFLNSWNRADDWAMVALRPGELPARADPDRYLQSVAALEPTASPAALQAAYAAAVRRWPGAPAARFGLAHAQQAAGELAAAERSYRALLDALPDHPAVLNNLAQVQLARGCRAAARATIRHALAVTPADSPLRPALEDTRAGIGSAGGLSNASPDCQGGSPAP